MSDRGYAVAQLVVALRCKSKGCRFDSRCDHFNFSLSFPFRPHCARDFDSVSKRNEQQGYFLGAKMTGA